MDLGKDQANDFQSQITSTTISFFRSSLLNYLNEIENYQTLGGFFELLADKMAVTSYSRRLFDFFMGLFKTSLAKIFDLFCLEDNFNSYAGIITSQLCTIDAFEGCET
ncbi:hypothetical protein KJ966_04765 [bacterium]|nr:hypothetical protein [bacterium]